MKNSLLILLIILSTFCIASGQTAVSVAISTGNDDLRGGNTAHMSFELSPCGRVATCRTSRILISRGMAGGTNARPARITFPEDFTASQIRSIEIVHDGSPRPGHPFDTYDNWDLKALRVYLGSETIYDSDKDFSVAWPVGFTGVNRFTKQYPSLTLLTRALENEPDFVITQLRKAGESVKITVRNNGSNGTIVNVICKYSGGNFRGSSPLRLNWPLASGQEQEFSNNDLKPPSGSTVTCGVTGQDSRGEREKVTINNALTRKRW